MKKQQETFASTMQSFLYHFDLRSVFEDFLTLVTCSFSQNPTTGLSNDEDLYLQTIGKYKDHKLSFAFTELLAHLITEMEERVTSESGNDVLGEYYEANLTKRGTEQFFTPWHICVFMTRCMMAESKKVEENRPLRILEPSCGSGRMLLAAYKELGPHHEYYGVDIDQTCVKMATLNLFLNGMFHTEVMCADFLAPTDFRGSYKTSFLPFGIFRIKEKENSFLWHLKRQSFSVEEEKKLRVDLGQPLDEGNQLILF